MMRAAPLILVATVPHTGTMFLHRLLTSHGLTWSPIGEGGQVEFAHLSPREIERIRKHPAPLVMTIRDRDKIRASWQADAHLYDGTVDEALACFDEIKDRAVVIDLEARTGLPELSRLVGIELRTDWQWP